MDRMNRSVEMFVRAKSKNWANKTLFSYQSTFDYMRKKFPRNIKLSSIGPMDLQDLIDNGQHYRTANPQPATRAKRYDHLKCFFGWAYSKARIIDMNPMDQVERPVTQRTVREIPSQEEMVEFIRRLPYPFNYLACLLAVLGPRSGEVIVNSKNWTAPVYYRSERCFIIGKSKTHRARKIPVPVMKIDTLILYKRHETLHDFIAHYTDSHGYFRVGNITTRDIWEVFRFTWMGMGRRFCVQTLRAWAGTHLISVAGGAFVPSKILGNTERVMLQSYASEVWNDKVDAVNQLAAKLLNNIPPPHNN